MCSGVHGAIGRSGQKGDSFPNFERRNGLLIVVIQDAVTLEVLQHGFMNRTAYDLTCREGRVWLWSTSKDKLWLKGATSDSIMLVRQAFRDCDGDSLLLRVEVTGKGQACHLKRHSCYEPVDLTTAQQCQD